MKLPARTLACLAGTALSLIAVATSCNVFDPLTSPSGDEQLISTARGCLDSGDYKCALENYAKLSDNEADVRASEAAYALIAQQGAGFKSFISAFGTDPSVTGLGSLITLVASDAGRVKRMALHAAFKKADTISDAKLKAMVRFLSATALTAEILAEIAGPDQVLNKTDLAASASCAETGCATSTACNRGVGEISSSSENGDIEGDSVDGATPSLDQLYTALSAAVAGLNEINPGGSSALSFGGLLPTNGKPSVSNMGLPTEPGSRCFRATLLGKGIGV